MQPAQSKLCSPRLYQKRGVEPGSGFRSAAPGHVPVDDTASHKYTYQAAFTNRMHTDEMLPVATPTITLTQVVIESRGAKRQVRGAGPRV